jgi:hypothetical protein
MGAWRGAAFDYCKAARMSARTIVARFIVS